MARLGTGLVNAWYSGSWWLIFLRPIELVFRSVSAIRRWVYSSGVKTPWRASVPVVVVGNITVGGTGKTPVVIALVEYLQSQGFSPGVVSRGYGAISGEFPHQVGTSSNAKDCGDEPLLIYQRTRCPCVVAPLRVEAAQYLLSENDVDIVICDDGLQHYALARDMEIVVVDQERGLGNGFCLPAGPLREPARRLRGVDHVLYRGSNDDSFGVQYSCDRLVNVHTGQCLPLSPQSIGEEIQAFAGIGQPGQFFRMLEQLGFSVTRHNFGDHHEYTQADIECIGTMPIVMTEKDAVKCRELAIEANTWFARLDAQLPLTVLKSVLALARPSNSVP